MRSREEIERNFILSDNTKNIPVHVELLFDIRELLQRRAESLVMLEDGQMKIYKVVENDIEGGTHINLTTEKPDWDEYNNDFNSGYWDEYDITEIGYDFLKRLDLIK